MSKHNYSSRAKRVFSFGMLVFALSTILVYLWGDLFVTEFQADIADTLLWSKATLDSGKLVSSSFYYPYVIPFGGNLIFLPFVACYGVSMTALRAGMTSFIFILTLTILCFFKRVVYHSWTKSSFATGLLLLLLSVNRKMREIMYAHILHYSLAIIFILLGIIILAKLIECEHTEHKLKILYVSFAALACFLCAAEGSAVIALSLFPLACAWFAERVLGKIAQKESKLISKRQFLLALICCIAALMGFVLYTLLSKGSTSYYSNQYFKLQSPSQWPMNFAVAGYQWLIDLFRPELYADAAPITRGLSLYGKISYCISIGFMLISPILLLVMSIKSYKGLETRAERIAVLSFWMLALTTLGMYVLLPIGRASWRMIPMFAMMIVCYIILSKSYMRSGQQKKQRLARFVAIMLCALALNSGIGVHFANTQAELWYEEDSLIQVLSEHGLTVGYCDEYKLCDPIELLANDEIHISRVEVRDGKVYPRLYQNDAEEYELEPKDHRYFLVRTTNLEEKAPDGAIERFVGRCFLPGYKKKENRMTDYEILVYDRPLLEDYYYVDYGDFYIDADGKRYTTQQIREGD